jgi:energy-coupling factor transporter ATP-binding protein EcfA2
MKAIKSIEITNSPFFEDLKIDFSQKLNCIMGGRGTGKTTLLYFLKSCIFNDLEEDKKIQSILRSNLGNGEINVLLEGANGKTYRITKTYNDFPQPHILPDLDFIDVRQIFDEIECDFYEAGDIEMIGRSKIDRLNLLDKKVKNQLHPLKNSIDEVQIDLANNAQDIKSYELRVLKLKNALSQYENIDEEFKIHKKQEPKGINAAEKDEFEKADLREKKRENEKRYFAKTLNFYNEINTDISYRINELEDSFKNLNSDSIDFINTEFTDVAVKEVEETVLQAKEKLKDVIRLFNNSQQKINILYSSLIEKQNKQQAEFVKLKQKFLINREYINIYNKLSKSQNDKNNLKKDLDEISQGKEKFNLKRENLILKLNDLKQQVFEIRLKNVIELNQQFEGNIIINLFAGGITDHYEDLLRDALKGSGMRYNELIPRIIDNFSPDEFAKVIQDKDVEELSLVSGIDEARSNSLISALYNTDEIFLIESTYCDDLPEFRLKIKGEVGIEENYRKSDELSMGQRCTAVLPIIFAVSSNPLIIDQPEDNLDNKYISGSIHHIIKIQKEQRQLIFITHNPNIPVLSNAEENIFLNYEKKTSIESTGTVDDVKSDIVNLLEGGEKAFRTRKEAYGY